MTNQSSDNIPPEQLSNNPELPEEISTFTKRAYQISQRRITKDEWQAGLRGTEVQDKNQKIMLRPFFAGGVYLLLVVQNIGIYYIIIQALEKNVLKDLQLIFATLIGGTLTQSYLILRLIAEKVFGEIAYENNKE